jgi:hypothetical protein
MGGWEVNRVNIPERNYDWIAITNVMRILLALAPMVVLTSSLCSGEPRWCSVRSDFSNTVVYPPIARAARVSGVVVMRMVYAPNGKALRTEPVFGPQMLSNSVTGQMKDWIVRTDDQGDELCETLVIAKFEFHVPDEPPLPPIPAQSEPPSLLRIWIRSELLVISDPGVTISSNPFRMFEYKVRRAVKRLFHKTS